MTAIRFAVLDAWGAAEPNAKDTVDMVVSVLIAEIEKNKSTARLEYESLKETYLNGAYRKAGYTKATCEGKLDRMTGEIMGLESALSVLYRAIDTTQDDKR